MRSFWVIIFTLVLLLPVQTMAAPASETICKCTVVCPLSHFCGTYQSETGNCKESPNLFLQNCKVYCGTSYPASLASDCTHSFQEIIDDVKRCNAYGTDQHSCMSNGCSRAYPPIIGVPNPAIPNAKCKPGCRLLANTKDFTDHLCLEIVEDGKVTGCDPSDGKLETCKLVEMSNHSKYCKDISRVSCFPTYSSPFATKYNEPPTGCYANQGDIDASKCHLLGNKCVPVEEYNGPCKDCVTDESIGCTSQLVYERIW